jgi:ABC-type dipeptide/oligopeptide/nickel transport system permease component
VGAYLARRVAQLVLVVWGALTIIFLLFFVLPGDPAELLTSEKAPQEQVDRVRKKYDLDKPIYVQYGNYMTRVVTWDLGKSFTTNESINAMVKDAGVNSLRLGFWAIVLEVIVGIGAGVYSAIRRYTFSDTVITLITIAASAIPVFVLGLLFQLGLGVTPNQRGWPKWTQFPTQGIGPDSWFLGFIPTGGQWKHLALPAAVLASVTTASLARVQRATVIDNQRSDYVRTARAKGLSQSKILLRHVLRNSLIPVVTLIAIDLGTAVGVAVLTESVFNWPGLGSKIADAVDGRDFNVLLGLSIVVIIVYAVANLIADITYGLLDPRIRVGGKATGR